MMGFLKNYLPAGIKIVFMAQPREIGYLSGMDINAYKKVALDVKWLGAKPNQTTGYWFDVADFDPPIDQIDIRSYGGVLVCWKSRDGQKSFLPEALRARIEREKKLRQRMEIYRKELVELINTIEKTKVSEIRKADSIEVAKQLKTMKNIVGDIEIRTNKNKEDGLSNLFKR